MHLVRTRSLTAGLVLAMTVVLTGYTIAPYAAVHERMTRAAKRCLDAAGAGGEKPSRCPQDLAKGPAVDVAWLRPAAGDAGVRYPTLEEAVRWPDDPTRQVAAPTLLKFGVTMGRKCARLARAAGRSSNTVNDGLLCNSHYGTMQFLHAQASDTGEAAVDTYDAVTRWATFLYAVASGRLPDDSLDAKYCDVFAGGDRFDRAMRPDTAAIPCEAEKDPAWTLTTLFTLRCGNLLQSLSCREDTAPSRFRRSRIVATGALLHLIQDSYSQSHCARGACERTGGNGVVTAKVECRPVTMFTTYRGQQRHADADRLPTFAPSCADGGEVDDPVTASAKVLWHVRQQSTPEAFLADFRRVFGTREAMEGAHPAGLGQCFGDRPSAT